MSFFARYASVRQHDASDCAAACLATVAQHHGRRLTVSRARGAIRTDARGTTALGLIEGAEALGFRARGVETDLATLRRLSLPAIAHWREHGRFHFVVVHRVTGRGIVIADPAIGVRVLSHAEFVQLWTRVVVLVHPEPAFQDSAADPSAFARVGRLLRPQLHLLGEAVLSTLVFTLIGLAFSFYVQAVVDSLVGGRHGWSLDVLALGMLGVVLFRGVLGALRSYFLVHVGQRLYAGVLSGYYRHLFALPMAFFDTRRVGELVSRLSDAARIRELLSSTVAAILVDVTMVIAATIAIGVFDPILALFAAGAVPLYGGVCPKAS